MCGLRSSDNHNISLGWLWQCREERTSVDARDVGLPCRVGSFAEVRRRLLHWQNISYCVKAHHPL